jgi:transposase
MADAFAGQSDLTWPPFADLFPSEPSKQGRGMPHTPFRNVVNTLLYGLMIGCRWGDIPRGPQWASTSAAHRWLQRWPADGTLAAMPAHLLGLAEARGIIQWPCGAIDGSFSPWQGRW